MRKRESTTERSVASPRKTATIKWTRRVDVIKILQQKVTSRRELMLRWFRKKTNSLKSADAISRYDFARVLEDHLHLHVEPSELKKIWNAAIEHCYAVLSSVNFVRIAHAGLLYSSSMATPLSLAENSL